MNRYYCTDGSRVSQAVIDTRRSEAYKKYTLNNPELMYCHGCGNPFQCFAHIIAKAQCKVLHKTELIWNPVNFFPACYACNLAIENPKGEAWKSLANIDQCLAVIEQHDTELYSKFLINQNDNGIALPTYPGS